ncbi:MAG: DUF2961 domain-containing protein [Oscillospiraceae bacterium]|nr:DUF2961 domain-containing protein [Oscillospiraceae bacterium]MBR2890662.1 DUF2961 domain-containing protein [Oscillospiraceae bacterium]
MLSNLCKKHDIESFSISPENFTGEKGCGGKAETGTGASCARDLGIGWKISPSVLIEAQETFTLADVQGEGAIKHIWVTDASYRGRELILRIYWDNNPTPSVEVPLSDFFASASYTEFRQISSLAVCVNPARGLNCYWEMPYRKGFRATLENISDHPITVYYQIDCERKAIPEDALYFHAQFRRTNPLPYKGVYTILDGIKGRGQYVGTYMYWGVNNNGWWGEGEIKFYLDGDQEFPTICGTGTEDYFCGAYNFDVNGKYLEYTTPYAGMSKVDKTDETYQANRRFNLYRWHITDPIYFQKDIRITIQALGWRSGGRYLPRMDDISSVAYWYSDTLEDVYPQLPDADALEII